MSMPNERSAWATISGVFGIALYAGTAALYAVSGLVVPYPWLWLLWLVWLGGLVALVAVFRRARAWTPAVAVVAVAFWFVFTTLGGALLDWTA